MQQVAVIGAGVVGLCSAVFLQQAGYQVMLIDRQEPGEGCSKGNAGHFATEQVFPLADARLLPRLPGMLSAADGPLRIRAAYLMRALPWFGRFVLNMAPARRARHQSALSQLNHHSIYSWKTLAGLCNASDLLLCKGSLLVSEQANKRALLKTYEAYRRAGIDVRVIGRDDLQELEPGLADHLHQGLDFTEVGHTLDPHALCLRLYRHFLNQGGTWLKSQVLRISTGRYVRAVETLDRTVRCEKVVVCAGAYSHQLTRSLGWRIPLEAERGYHLMVKPNQLPRHQLQRPVTSMERKFIMTPMLAGLRLAGTVEFAGLSAPPDYRRAYQLLGHANRLLKQPHTPLSDNAVWHGNRPSLPDSLPVLGPCPKFKGVFYNFGHQHLGLTQAAFSAEIMTQCLKGQRPAIDISPFSIGRF
ncbi:NAD(P)/FAD-dependent oxidoreductase [Bowmanella dokdonensis]|uniref:FAD-binding oxidoreductase n=1 Tax=Bowmanella dokdonensis TaxID=751969 RepID=A0A939DN15_9ALTE|nr:FAD-dependent oxidoreductase [Bowmanella dokdonensis]MBN7825237.1 FAD-binding oxidoreductase [Bowmanella dokdonensis]